MAFAKQALENTEGVTSLTASNNQLTVEFAEPLAELDEKSRLLATNPFQALRLFTELDGSKQHPFSVFLGGALAFDMIATSEPLPEVVAGDNTCPDYVFYLAETLVAIDHEQQSTEIIGNSFSTKTEVQEQIQQQLAGLQVQLNQSFNTPEQTVNSAAQAVKLAVILPTKNFALWWKNSKSTFVPAISSKWCRRVPLALLVKTR